MAIVYMVNGFLLKTVVDHIRSIVLAGSTEVSTESVGLLAQSRFCPIGPPKVFRIFGGCRTRRICSGKCSSNSFAVPVLSLRSTGIPENAQAALAKIDIRSQIRQIHSSQVPAKKPDKREHFYYKSKSLIYVIII